MKDTVELIEANEIDWQKVLDIETECKSRLFVAFENEAEVKEILKTDNVYFIKVNNEFIGDMAIRIKETEYYLSFLRILPKYQRKGYASKALKLILNKFDKLKYSLTVHPENTSALILYLKAEFKIIGWKDNVFGDGEPRLLMEKK